MIMEAVGDNSAGPPLSELDFKRFQKLIFDAAGIHLSAVKRPMVAGRLAKRLKALSLVDYATYLLRVERDPAEYQLVIDLLTTNETYFFREPKHFDFLRERILPGCKAGQSFSVWSAACSSGEEPYSLAMLLTDQLGERDWSIFASDISTQVLARARAGQYSMTRIDQVPTQYLKRFCLRGVGAASGRLLVDRKLRERVQFQQLNLMASLHNLPLFDLILLRNVMIYFNADTKQQLIARIAGRLKAGGHLFIGHSETLNGLASGLTQIAPAIYQRV